VRTKVTIAQGARLSSKFRSVGKAFARAAEVRPTRQ
jgi:hypothetical protein